MLLTIVLFGLFASIFGLSKETLNHCEPFFLIGSRMAFAGLLLLAHQCLSHWFALRFAQQSAPHPEHQADASMPLSLGKTPTTRWSLSHLFYLFLLAFLMIYLCNVSEIWGLQHMASAKACLIYSLSPFLSAAMAFIILKERLGPKKWLGLCVGFMGLIPIFVAQAPNELNLDAIMGLSLAELSLLMAVFASVCGWILLKKVIQDYQDTPLMANGISMTLGGAMALLHSYYSGESWDPLPIMHMLPFLKNTLIMCVVSNIVCYNLYGYLLKRYSATFMSLAGLVTPFFAAFFGWYFLNETITWHYFASIGIFGLGLFLFYQEELQQEKLQQKGSDNQRAAANALHNPIEQSQTQAQAI